MQVPVEFLSRSRIVGRETCSKLLDPSSRLYKILRAVKEHISKRFELTTRMDFHVQLIKNAAESAFLEERTRVLQGHVIDLFDLANWYFLRRAFVLRTPEMKGYGATHITVAYISTGKLPNIAKMSQILLEALRKEQALVQSITHDDVLSKIQQNVEQEHAVEQGQHIDQG